MPDRRITPVRYVAAVLAVGIAIGVQFLVLTKSDFLLPPAALFLLAIGFSSWWGGVGPGILAIALAVLGGDVLNFALEPEILATTRFANAMAVVVVGVLTSVMMIHRVTQTRIQVERQQDAALRRRTEEHLVHEQHRLTTLLEHSPDRIYFKDRQSRFVVCSPSVARQFGFERTEQVIGKSDFDIFTREHAQPAYDDEQEIMRTGLPMINKEEKETWPDGRVAWASSTKAPFRDINGVIIGTFGISRDITERKLADNALREAKQAAEEANLAKGQFLANMSHEIRTPLSAVVGMAEILLDSDLTAEQREFAQIIHQSGNGLVLMLNDILDFSKNEAGKLELEAIPFDLGLAIDEVVHLLAANAEAKNLELILRVAPDAPTRLIGDPSRLRQVMSNLIGNAIKFTDQGHVFIDLTITAIDDHLATVRIKVSDTGIGIPADKLDHIFEKFTQADTSTTRRFGGTGLGLAICRQLAEGMGGALHVESRPEAGSTFVFSLTLPLAGGTSPRLPQQVELAGARVLVVEANPIHQRVIAEQLSSWGCVPVSLSRADEALAAFPSANCQLAIIDTTLPDRSGVDLGRDLRAHELGRTCGLILLTSIGKRGDAKVAESAGFNAYLVKPVRTLDLGGALAAVRAAQLAGKLDGLVTRHTLAEERGHSSAFHRRKTR